MSDSTEIVLRPGSHPDRRRRRGRLAAVDRGGVRTCLVRALPRRERGLPGRVQPSSRVFAIRVRMFPFGSIAKPALDKAWFVLECGTSTLAPSIWICYSPDEASRRVLSREASQSMTEAALRYPLRRAVFDSRGDRAIVPLATTNGGLARCCGMQSEWIGSIMATTMSRLAMAVILLVVSLGQQRPRPRPRSGRRKPVSGRSTRSMSRSSDRSRRARSTGSSSPGWRGWASSPSSARTRCSSAALPRRPRHAAHRAGGQGLHPGPGHATTNAPP